MIKKISSLLVIIICLCSCQTIPKGLDRGEKIIWAKGKNLEGCYKSLGLDKEIYEELFEIYQKARAIKGEYKLKSSIPPKLRAGDNVLFYSKHTAMRKTLGGVFGVNFYPSGYYINIYTKEVQYRYTEKKLDSSGYLNLNIFKNIETINVE